MITSIRYVSNESRAMKVAERLWKSVLRPKASRKAIISVGSQSLTVASIARSARSVVAKLTQHTVLTEIRSITCTAKTANQKCKE